MQIQKIKQLDCSADAEAIWLAAKQYQAVKLVQWPNYWLLVNHSGWLAYAGRNFDQQSLQTLQLLAIGLEQTAPPPIKLGWTWLIKRPLLSQEQWGLTIVDGQAITIL